MKQNAYIFDIENHKIGVARSKCNDDQDMIFTEQDYLDYGTEYGIDKTLMEKTIIKIAENTT